MNKQRNREEAANHASANAIAKLAVNEDSFCIGCHAKFGNEYGKLAWFASEHLNRGFIGKAKLAGWY